MTSKTPSAAPVANCAAQVIHRELANRLHTGSNLDAFLVLDVNKDARLVVLFDGFGHYHVVRYADTFVSTGETLYGDPAALGSAVLVAKDKGRGDIYPVIYELVSCTKQSTFDCLSLSASN